MWPLTSLRRCHVGYKTQRPAGFVVLVIDSHGLYMWPPRGSATRRNGPHILGCTDLGSTHGARTRDRSVGNSPRTRRHDQPRQLNDIVSLVRGPTFPFGRPVTPRPASSDGQRTAFILGAYPSALHVHWTPPEPYRSVQALAVDNEPEPFWEGEDESECIEIWKATVGFTDRLGTIECCRRFNGPSGVKLRERYLEPLGLDRDGCWITDALDTYRLSNGQRARIDDTFDPVAKLLGLGDVTVRPHPSEGDVVKEAVELHLARLSAELARASPSLIVTLGNAAQRVLRELVHPDASQDPGPRVLPGDNYGRAVELHIEGRCVTWVPLAHPAAPARYQAWHDVWAREIAPNLGCNA